MNMLKKIHNKNIVKASIVSAVMLISTVLSNIVASNAAVEAVVPPGATMDMFDYYVMGKDIDQNYECYAHPEIATRGINAGKQLKFLYNNAVRNHSYDATTAKWMRSVVNDYVNNNDYSFVNNIGYGNPKVDSSGYPHVVDPGRIDTSIGYLFDSSSRNGKISYMNAKPNIFKKTSDGSYSYNSYDNFARFDTGKKTFTLESKAGGGFFPFDSMSTDYTRCNHYFGMHVTQPFYLPANLKTETGKDIVFQFSGDDDVYIDIDGAVISLNIFLSWHGCTINFSTGAISTDTAGYKADYTLKDLFTRAGITPTGGFSGNTLAGDTYHTLNFYYLERGNWGSNCILKYNIQTKPLTVSYNGNGSDTGDDKDVASHVDESMRIENNWFGRAGYDFKGWNTKADGTGASYEEGDKTAFTEDTTLYAIWTPRTYTIAFDSNSTDATGSMSPMPMTYDVGKALTSNSFSRIGYKFIGWRSSDAATGREYADGATVSNLTSTDKATVTMYAQWQPISYTVKFNKNRPDATGSMPDMSFKYNETKRLTPNVYSSASAKFAGIWNTSPNGSGATYQDGESVTNLTEENGGTVTLYAQWSINSYIVTFIDGHDGTTLKTENVEHGHAATPPAMPQHTGYTPLGWSGYDNITGNTVIRLEYRKNTYQIAFDANGGTGSMGNQQMSYDTKTALNANKFSRTGYTYIGWRLDDKDNGTAYADGEEVENLTSEDGATLTMYAQWSSNEYDISFNANAKDATGATPSMHMSYDETRNLTKNGFSRTGYIFSGWRLSDAVSGTEYADGASVANLSSESNGSVTLYAQWTPISYRIRFDGNKADATGTTPEMSMRYGETKTLSPNGFSSPSAKWTGWNASADGTGISYSNGQGVKNLTAEDGGTVTLYAQWSTNYYTVTFVDGHDGTTISTARVRHGADAIPPTKPHHDGYTAKEWEGDYSGVTEDRTVTLAYRANRYRIAFDANGGSGTMPNQHLEYGKKSNLSANAFARTGYSFTGWRLGSKDNGTKYSDRQEVLNLTDIDDGVLTMYAQWTPHSYTIRYDANGGKGSISDQRMTYDKADKLKANAFTRNGYTWAGWRRDDAATGTQYRNRQEVKNLLPDDGGSTTMYAQWTRNTYIVTFIDGLDGSTIGTIGAEYGQKAEAPTAPSHTGYTPSGWDSDFSNVTGDITVTMGYRANRYRIEFDKNSVRASGSTAGMQMEYGKTASLTRNGFSLDGHDWLYWTDDADGNGRQYSDAQSVTDLTADDGATVTLYAQWKIRRYTVTFIDGMTGDVISRTEVEHGGKAAAPAIPKHSGYKATGWSKPFGNVTGDIKTTIGYEPIRYTVAFDGNAAEAVGSMQKMGMSYGESKALAANAFSHPGYRFVGWGLKPEGGVSFPDCGTVENLTDVDGETVTLYAQWVERDAVHIGYKASPADGGAVSNGEETLNPETGEAKGSTAEVATGYRFIGWYSGDTKVSDDAALIPVKPAGGWIDSSYEARFEKMRFTVSFVGKDGGKLKEEEVEYGDSATAPDAPHVDGYEFIGWDRKFDSVTEDITVKALYRELPIAPAPAAPEPAPEPEPADEGAEPDLMQTGVETTAVVVAMAIGTVSTAAVAVAARRKR